MTMQFWTKLDRVLDDRAGDRVCRPAGQCRIGRSAAEVLDERMAERGIDREHYA
jgi:hypothetical protein